jgi:hypothetical protein
MADMKVGLEQVKAASDFSGKRGPSDNHPRKREGKTRRDRESGATQRAYANRQARADWQNNGGDFPYAHCNGKRNRHLWTARGNTQVVKSFASSGASGKAKGKKK